MNITPYNFSELSKKGISLDLAYLLTLVRDGYDISSLPGTKIKALIQSLERKMLIDKDQNLLSDGKAILEFMSTSGTLELLKRAEQNRDFELWWKAYPSTDTIILSGKVRFKGSRGLKVKKDDCRIKFSKIMAEGEYTVGEMVAAISYEVSLKCQRSIDIGENKMSYMQNSLTYLNQRTFENFIDLAKQGKIEVRDKKQETSSVDI